MFPQLSPALFQTAFNLGCHFGIGFGNVLTDSRGNVIIEDNRRLLIAELEPSGRIG